MDKMAEHTYLDVGQRRIAIMSRTGEGPGLVWLGGFRSDMTATKASHLEGVATRHRLAYTRFDYGGHGQSDGAFADFTLSDWIADALAVLTRATSGPQLLIGSSMGGWIALRLAETLIARGDSARLAGLVLIAPAPDFTERLMWQGFSQAIRREITEKGVWLRPSAYAPEPTPITRALIEDGRRHFVLDRGLDLPLPIHIVHGTGDPDVPAELSVELMGRLRRSSVTMTLIKDGDHRLSSPEQLAALERIVLGMVSEGRGSVNTPDRAKGNAHGP
jgi:pimeloyl-ACP methyl ester carboxylesterase